MRAHPLGQRISLQPARAMRHFRTLVTSLSTCALLIACDAKGGSSASSVIVLPGPELAEAGHVLRRVGFGPTPLGLQEVAQRGAAWYVEQQLQPEGIDETSSHPLNAWLALLPVPQSEADQPRLVELVERQLARALYSPRQLVESMTVFWDGHFNTNYWTVFNWHQNGESRAAWLETRENELFRKLCLGRFEALLLASATSPAMLITLDNVSNVAGNPNENYARELVELFTMGVDNGYTQRDVEELARCFTGWGVCELAPGDVDDPLAPCAGGVSGASLGFHFDPALHDSGPKTIFAGTGHELALPARFGAAGLDDGFDVLRHVAALPQTANYLCWKLARKFVADDPSPALVAACVDVWMQSGGDVESVLRTLLNSAEFMAKEQRWNKVETPLESLCSTVRALEGIATRRIEFTNLRGVLEVGLHQSLFRWLEPDGFPETADEQLGTARMLGRIAFNEWIYLGEGDDISFDIQALVQRHGATPRDAVSIVAVLGSLLHQENFSAADAALAVEFLNTDANNMPLALDPEAPNYGRRLREVAAFVASLPQGVEQ